jgi:hypothetical protein
VQCFALKHDARLDQLLVVLPHLGEKLLAGHHARRGILRRVDQDQDIHRKTSRQETKKWRAAGTRNPFPEETYWQTAPHARTGTGAKATAYTSGTSATARHQPALAPRILTGKQET